MILRNLDFNLSLFMIKGVSRFYKSLLPFNYDGVLFKALQSNKTYVQKQLRKREYETLFFFCLGLKSDTASYNVPFFIPAEDDNFLVSTNPRKPIVDSYYTSYAYTFRYPLLDKVKSYFYPNTVRFFKRKRFKNRWRVRRLFRRLTKKRERFWWTEFFFSRKLYKKEAGVNVIKPIFAISSVKFENKNFFF